MERSGLSNEEGSKAAVREGVISSATYVNLTLNTITLLNHAKYELSFWIHVTLIY